jgi:hypothetical protein
MGSLPARRRAIHDVAAPAIEIGPRQQAAMGATARPAATIVVIVAPTSIVARRAAEPLTMDEDAAGEGRGRRIRTKRYDRATATASEACHICHMGISEFGRFALFTTCAPSRIGP